MTATNDGIIHLRGKIEGGKLVALLDHQGQELGGPVTSKLNEVTGVIEIPGDIYRPGGECCFVMPMQQASGSGNPIDVSGAMAQCLILPEYTDAAAWANRGYFTSGATLGYSIAMPNKHFRWNMDTDSVIFSAVINKSAPVGNEGILGCCNTTTRYGFYVQARGAGGKVRVFINTSSGYVAGLSDSSAVFCDGTDHTLTVMIHGPSKSVFLFCDGVICDQWLGCYVGGNDVTANFAFGGTQDTGTAYTPVACKFKGVHMYRYRDGGLPINAAEIARYIHQNPFVAVPSVMVGARKAPVWTLALCGQSNEKGSGSFASRVGRLGAPIGDGIAPQGTSGVGSMWPRVAEQLGNSGIWLNVFNTARGSSSIVNHWAGRIVAWSAGARMAYGQYTVADGKVYRVTVASGGQTNGTTGGSAPVWPTSGTVVDGQLTWTYLRAATGADTIGKVMKEGDDLFDPNGWVAYMVSQSATVPTAAKRLIYIAQGQEDATRGSTRAEYLSALKAVTDYCITRGYEVRIGLSFYADTLDAQYTGQLIPAINDALSYYAGNPLVKAGVDMRTTFGVLPVSPPRGTLGLKADGLHVTDETIAAAAALIAPTLM